MTPSPIRHAAAAGLVLALLSLAPPPLQGAELGRLEGRVYQADGLTPRRDAVVHLVTAAAETISAPTSGDGSFRIDRAPVGDYRLVVQTQEGAFLAPQSVRVQTGGGVPLALSLRGARPSYQQTAGLGSSTSKPLEPWAKWLIVGGVSVVALLVIDDLSDDKEEPVSPFFNP
jgi:hypothetical protein